MRRLAVRLLCCSAVSAALAAVAVAQQIPAAPAMNDPRVGLKAGFQDAGEAAKNMERIASLSKPKGFFLAESPAGTPMPPEPKPGERPGPPGQAAGAGAAGQAGEPAGAPRPPRKPSGLDFANSDLAFSKNHVIQGNFHGFNTFDVDSARHPRLVASIVCPGGQGDVSIYGHLLFMSVEQTSGRIDCGTEGVDQPVSKERFRGVRIFDISDLRNPKQVAAIQTCRGSHTHTLVPDPKDPGTIYVYGQGTSTVRSGDELAGCSGKDPKDDPNTSLFSIDVIKVPLDAPEKAAVVNRPRIFADEKTGAIAGLEKGGDRGQGAQPARATNQCHDITAYPEIGLAAGACAGNGLLLDISDPAHPVRIDAVSDKNFAYWHSATFNNDGTKVVFTDEWGGGTRPRCRATDPPNWGADAVFDIVDHKLKFESYYKMPAPQTDQENCVAHNGSLVPVPGRDIMVQGWYQGGVSVFDFTDSAKPVEIAYFDRGPIDAKQLITGGFWSAYWYDGYVYGSEIARGLDVFRLLPSEYLSANEIEAASLVRVDEENVQEQRRVSWPAVPVVGRAYLDQLNRDHAIPEARAAAVKAALDSADQLRRGATGAAEAAGRLESLSTEVEREAGSATGRDAMRLKALGETMRGIAARLK
ncbi:MAG: LVIVD repeat-containing protein [Betaproteobacteria bacterium]